MAYPMSRLIFTVMGASTFGRMSRKMVRVDVAPTPRLASTYVSFFTESTSPYVRRAYHGHQTAAMASIEFVRLASSATLTESASTSGGTERNTSVTRISVMPTPPPR